MRRHQYPPRPVLGAALLVCLLLQPVASRLSPARAVATQGRALSQLETTDDFDKIKGSLELAAATADTISQVLEATQTAAQAARAIGALSAISGFAGFLGPALELGLALAGVPSAVETLITEGFAKINSKLDALAGAVDDLGDEIKAAIEQQFSLAEWGDASASARAISDKVREWLAEPTSQAVLDRLKATCSDENPEKLVATLADIMLCKGPNKCLSQAIKQTAEFEQVKYFNMARLVVRDANLAVQMSESCSQAEGTPASIRSSRNAAMAALLKEITDRVQADYIALETEFWDTAFTKIKELTESKNGDANEVLADTMLTDLQSRYPHMHWGVAVYNADGFNNHVTNGCTDSACTKEFPIGVLSMKDIGEAKKDVVVMYRPQRWSTDQDPTPRLAAYRQECADSGSDSGVEPLFDCLVSKADVFGMNVVRFGNGWRGNWDSDIASGMAVLSGTDEGANTLDGEVTLFANIGQGTVDNWSQPPLDMTPVVSGPLPVVSVPSADKCDQCNSCTCDANCDCTDGSSPQPTGNKCDQCNSCTCDANCDCIDGSSPQPTGDKCDQCNSCTCDANCDCTDGSSPQPTGDKCDQCNSCTCDANCDCTDGSSPQPTGDKCDQCNSCTCDANCDCI